MSLSYATCAYCGCDKKICYGFDKKTRPRYCSDHETVMRERLFRGNIREIPAMLYIEVVKKPEAKKQKLQ